MRKEVDLEIERPCSWDEYKTRIDRVRAQMHRRNMDALLITSLHSIYYLFGIDRLVSAGVFCGVWLALDKQTITVSYFDHDLIFQQSPLIGDLRLWDKDPLQAAQRVAQAYVDLGRPQRVGVESNHSAVAPDVYMAIDAKLRKEGADIVEASDLVTRLRVVKSEAEARCMRRAARILDAHYEAAFVAMQPRATERDVAGAAVAASYGAGGDFCIHPPLISSGINTLHRTFHAPSSRQFERGDIVVLEAGAAFLRYNVVACHTVIVDATSTEEHRQHYSIAREQVDHALSQLKPGVRTSDLVGARGERGVDMIYSTGIGFQDIWYEGFPLFPGGGNDKEWVLEPGTFLSVFGSVEKEGRYMMLCVDPVLITATGYELLTQLDRSELRVVG